MSTNDLPLDEAALDECDEFIVRLDRKSREDLISQARAALTLRARVAECVRAAAAVTGTDAEMCATESGPDTNHGVVLSALNWQGQRVAELEGELAGTQRVALELRDTADKWHIHAAVLRDALEGGNRRLGYWCDLHGSLPEDVSALAGMQAALASTPAESLAAYRKSVLEEAAAVCEVIERREYEEGDHGAWCGPCECKDAIRALAAQEVK